MFIEDDGAVSVAISSLAVGQPSACASTAPRIENADSQHIWIVRLLTETLIGRTIDWLASVIPTRYYNYFVSRESAKPPCLAKYSSTVLCRLLGTKLTCRDVRYMVAIGGYFFQQVT
jgi:hypothetical protein